MHAVPWLVVDIADENNPYLKQEAKLSVPIDSIDADELAAVEGMKMVVENSLAAYVQHLKGIRVECLVELFKNWI